MPDKPQDATPEEIANEEGLRRFEDDVASLQENVMPIDATRTDARIRAISAWLRGSLSPIQRLEFFFIGIMLGGFALMQVCFVFPRLLVAFGWPKAALPTYAASILFLPLDAILFAVGIKLIVSALSPNRRRSHR
ncbi:MAG TPA: hypothetical protein VGU63_04100 [Candidatus Acidoferrales bacterium]|nr:hypothetical protein [Candidatus Acidoferrales bacterium]